MRWCSPLVWLSLLSCSGRSVLSIPDEPTAHAHREHQAPDIAWGGWWPISQWTLNDTPPSAAQVRGRGRSWKYIDFHEVETPWGEASASLWKRDSGPGLSFNLSFTRAESEPVWVMKGEMEASVLSGSKLTLSPTNGDPETRGGFGRMGMMTTTVQIQFPWLPDTLADPWIRLKMKDRCCWLLIPYGFGADDSEPVPLMTAVLNQPGRPPNSGARDQIVTWKEVVYDLGGKWILEARLSNPMDGRGRLTLCHSDSKDWNAWALSRPRTTMAIGIPEGRILSSTCRSITRADDNMRREDQFHFYRQPDDARCWALLRVTVEEDVFERAIPSSLFLYCHGGSLRRD